jgi:hypothetical protein
VNYDDKDFEKISLWRIRLINEYPWPEL